VHIQLPCPHTSAGLHIVCAHTSACLVTTEFRSAHLYIRSSLACTYTVTLKSLQVNLSIYPICAGISVLACCVRSSIHPRYIPRSNLQSALCHIRWSSVTLAHLYITAQICNPLSTPSHPLADHFRSSAQSTLSSRTLAHIYSSIHPHTTLFYIPSI